LDRLGSHRRENPEGENPEKANCTAIFVIAVQLRFIGFALHHRRLARAMMRGE
jgi:hypothetical protein